MVLVFFVFKQKTAYEMRISDWSSDVCSSDLQLFPREGETRPRLRFPEFRDAPEWEERPLGQVIEVASGQVDPTESPYCDLPHVGGENIECETGNLAGLKSAREDGVISGTYLFDERDVRSEEHTSELQSLMRISYAVFCLKKKN